MEGGLKNIDQLRTYLNTKGLKSTKQRDIIVKTFLQTQDHIDIHSLYQKVRETFPNLGYATVYRTMKLLKECGVACERHFGTRYAVYEPSSDHAHHDHLICLECNKIVEFENKSIERLQEQVAKKYNYTLLHHKHELYGHCKDCKEKLNEKI